MIKMPSAHTIAALYVETGGCYFGIDGVDPWDESRDPAHFSSCAMCCQRLPWRHGKRKHKGSRDHDRH